MIPAEHREELLAHFYRDPVSAMRGLLPEWFPTKMPWVHRGIVALVLSRTDFLLNFGREAWAEGEAEWTQGDLEAIVRWFTYKTEDGQVIPLFKLDYADGVAVACHLTTSRFIEVMLPRGMSKTTLFNALMVIMTGFKLADFIMYISETQTHAETQLSNVKRVMESNTLFRELFGNLVPERNDPAKWTEDYIEPLNGVKIRARGRGGQIRGSNIDAKRPDIILIDDVEDEESVKTVEQRGKTLKWFMGSVVPALPRHKGQIFLLGTMLHEEALMLSLQRDSDWIAVTFGAMLEDDSPLWPWYMTKPAWDRLRTKYQRLGQISLFYLEYQSSLYLNADDRKFKPEEWAVQVMTRDAFEAVALAVDPAISDSATADFCTFAVVGMTGKGMIHLLDLHGERGMDPTAQVDKFFELHFRWSPTFHGVEAVAYQCALIHLLKEEMHRRSAQWGARAYFAIQPLRHRQAKVERVEGILVPRYSAGYITHQRNFPALVNEALDWPRGKKDHLDVEAMAISLLSPVSGLAVPAPGEDREVYDLPRGEWARVQEAAWQCP